MVNLKFKLRLLLESNDSCNNLGMEKRGIIFRNMAMNFIRGEGEGREVCYNRHQRGNGDLKWRVLK